jgi:hypothetical protein
MSALCYADAAWDWRVCSGMLRRCSCIAFAVMLVTTAQAADTTLTLACQGTVTTKVFLGKFVDYEPEPISAALLSAK